MFTFSSEVEFFSTLLYLCWFLLLFGGCLVMYTVARMVRRPDMEFSCLIMHMLQSQSMPIRLRVHRALFLALVAGLMFCIGFKVMAAIVAISVPFAFGYYMLAPKLLRKGLNAGLKIF